MPVECDLPYNYFLPLLALVLRVVLAAPPDVPAIATVSPLGFGVVAFEALAPRRVGGEAGFSGAGAFFFAGAFLRVAAGAGASCSTGASPSSPPLLSDSNSLLAFTSSDSSAWTTSTCVPGWAEPYSSCFPR